VNIGYRLTLAATVGTSVLMDIGESSIRVSSLWSSIDREISVHYFEYRSLHCLEHVHGELSINIPLDSPLSYRVGNDMIRVEPGTSLVIQPGEWHTGVDLPHGMTISVNERILKSLCSAIYPSSDLPEGHVSISRFIKDERLNLIGHELAHEMRHDSAGRNLVIKSLVTQYLIYVLRGWATPLRCAPQSNRHLHAFEMVRAIEHMNNCPKSSFGLQSLCAAIGTSQSRFVSLFSASTGSSTLVFYNYILIQKAKHLLVQSSASIKEVAFTLEFQSESHFCNLFRSVAGISPTAFRDGGKIVPLYRCIVRR
jgi:AraC-like DNA-binding protein